MDLDISIEGNVHELPLVSYGVSSMVYEVSKSAVIKASCGTEESKKQLAIERTIYDRLGTHPSITKVLATHKNMLIFERLQYPLRKRLWDIRDNNQRPPVQDVIRWSIQVTQGLEHVHSNGILQVDIGAHNVLLDASDGAKLSDFAGSSIDGSIPSIAPSPCSEHPDMPARIPTRKSELFGLGSLLYEIETIGQPYHGRSDRDIESLFRAGEFPDTSTLVLEDVILKCWMSEYMTAGDATKDIEQIRKKMEREYSVEECVSI